MNTSKFTLFKSEKNQQYYFNLKAANNEIILRSEGYETKDGCLNGIKSVKENAPDDDRYRRLKSVSDQPYFNLTAKNNKIIGTSQMYSSEAAREKGIESVKRNAPNAPIVDVTDNAEKCREEANAISDAEKGGGLVIMPKHGNNCKDEIPVKPKQGSYGD